MGGDNFMEQIWEAGKREKRKPKKQLKSENRRNIKANLMEKSSKKGERQKGMETKFTTSTLNNIRGIL